MDTKDRILLTEEELLLKAKAIADEIFQNPLYDRAGHVDCIKKNIVEILNEIVDRVADTDNGDIKGQLEIDKIKYNY